MTKCFHIRKRHTCISYYLGFHESKMISFVKLEPSMWFHPTPDKHDFDQFESMQSKLAFTEVAHFL